MFNGADGGAMAAKRRSKLSIDDIAEMGANMGGAWKVGTDKHDAVVGSCREQRDMHRLAAV